VEKETAAAWEAAAAAAKAAEAAKSASAARADKPATSLGADDRLGPQVAFADARGLLPKPANGRILTAFGAADGLGGRSPGETFTTRDGATISSPADGWVVFAGPFRSYGQLLIINAGDGYHVLLAGMEHIDVQLGQLVLAGEPVATMPSRKVAQIGAVDTPETGPVLYVEFRKDGVSIDPEPWWVPSDKEKVGG
jgi:septal ring factor EnvC (AmiA/AmiB activator)